MLRTTLVTITSVGCQHTDVTLAYNPHKKGQPFGVIPATRMGTVGRDAVEVRDCRCVCLEDRSGRRIREPPAWAPVEFE